MALMGRTSWQDTLPASHRARSSASSMTNATGCMAWSTSTHTEYWVSDTRTTVPSDSRTA